MYLGRTAIVWDGEVEGLRPAVKKAGDHDVLLIIPIRVPSKQRGTGGKHKGSPDMERPRRQGHD